MGILGNLFRTRLYSVMNDDHAQMFELLSNLRKLVNTGDENDPTHRREVEDGIRKLVEASTVHFFREEALMKACRYPEATQHRAEHLFLIRSAQTFQAGVFRQPQPITNKTVIYLRDWVVNHINESDRRLDTYLRAYGGPINDGALTDTEWKALAPHTVDLTARGLTLWATLNFFKNPRAAAAAGRDAKAAATDEQAAGQRLARMGKHNAKPTTRKQRYENSVRSYNGYYYGNY